MLADIRGAIKNDKKAYLFMDNANYHKNLEVKEEMRKLNIEPVLNVAYRFEYNPCERMWSKFKHNYR